jgi:hypothetical protein
MYSIVWPVVLAELFAESSSFAYLDVMGTLGVSCMSSFEYFDVLVIFTVFPLVGILMLSMPSLCIVVMGRVKFGGFKLHPKYGQVVNNFFRALMLWMFIIYPTVSVTVLNTFNCDDALERLRVDYQVICPWMSGGGIFWYVIVTHIYMIVFNSHSNTESRPRRCLTHTATQCIWF